MRVLLVSLLVTAVKAPSEFEVQYDFQTEIELICDGARPVKPGFSVDFEGKNTGFSVKKVEFFPKPAGPTNLPEPRMTLRVKSHAQRTWRRTEDVIKDFMESIDQKAISPGHRHAYAIKDGNKRIPGGGAAEWLTNFTDPQKIPSGCRTKTLWYRGTPIRRIKTENSPEKNKDWLLPRRLSVLHRTELVETVDALDGMDDEELIAFLKELAEEKGFFHFVAVIVRELSDQPPRKELCDQQRKELCDQQPRKELCDQQRKELCDQQRKELCDQQPRKAKTFRELSYKPPRRGMIARQLKLFSPFFVERGRVDDLSVIVKALETAKAELPKFKLRYASMLRRQQEESSTLQTAAAPVPEGCAASSHKTTSSRTSQSATTVQKKSNGRSQQVMDRSRDTSTSNSQSGTAVPRTGSKIDNSSAVDCLGPFIKHCVELSKLKTDKERFAYLAGLQDRAIADALSHQLRIESEAENRRSSRLIEQSRF